MIDGSEITTEQLATALHHLMEIKRPCFIWGSYGIGKSDVVAQVAEELGYDLIDLRLGQMDPTDIRGIPFYNKDINKMDWAEPIDLPTQEYAATRKGIVLFLDELNTAPPATQASAYQLILNRRVGKYILPDNVVIVSAGNRDSDGGVTYKMPLPLKNRFVHLRLRADFDSWQSWAIKNKTHKDILGYLNFAKQDLCGSEVAKGQDAINTPRSWSFVNDILQGKELDSSTEFNLISGAVGVGIATKFRAHRKFAAKLPDVDDVLQGRVKKVELDEPSAAFSIIHACLYGLKELSQNGKEEELVSATDNFFNFIVENLDSEYVIVSGCLFLSVKHYNIPVSHKDSTGLAHVVRNYGKYLPS